jgi:hypothetical protein
MRLAETAGSSVRLDLTSLVPGEIGFGEIHMAYPAPVSADLLAMFAQAQIVLMTETALNRFERVERICSVLHHIKVYIASFCCDCCP